MKKMILGRIEWKEKIKVFIKENWDKGFIILLGIRKLSFESS